MATKEPIIDPNLDPATGEYAVIAPGHNFRSVTQKIAAIEDYDQIILLMEGELVASGTHSELSRTCPEYVQIYQSQRSTSHYEQPELQS